MIRRDDPTPTPDRPLCTINEAVIQLGVCRRTIHNWLSRGKLEYLRTAGGRVRIYVDTLWRRG